MPDRPVHQGLQELKRIFGSANVEKIPTAVGRQAVYRIAFPFPTSQGSPEDTMGHLEDETLSLQQSYENFCYNLGIDPKTTEDEACKRHQRANAFLFMAEDIEKPEALKRLQDLTHENYHIPMEPQAIQDEGLMRAGIVNQLLAVTGQSWIVTQLENVGEVFQTVAPVSIAKGALFALGEALDWKGGDITKLLPLQPAGAGKVSIPVDSLSLDDLRFIDERDEKILAPLKRAFTPSRQDTHIER